MDDFINDDLNSSDDDDDKDDGRQPFRKLLTANRLVNSYDDILRPCNVDKSNDGVETLTGYMGPKNNPNTEKIFWSTQEPSVGRQRSCDILTYNHSVVRYSNGIETISDCFSKLIDDEMVD